MYFEITLIVTRPNDKGVDKDYKEKYFVENCEVFSEAEYKGFQYYNNEADVDAIKKSKVREFVNNRVDVDDDIYIAVIEDIFINDDGEEKRMKYEVGLFAKDIKEATSLTNEYLKQGMNDFELVKVYKTKFLDII